MGKNSNKATLALGFVTVGFLGTHPYSGTFIGGMLNSGFGAAMVGGLADWFAVTALFRKPLGFISWRTEVILRNRERIFNDLVTLVEGELLTEENIMAVVQKYDVADLVLDYLNDHDGRENVGTVLNQLGQDVLCSISAPETGRFVDQLLKEQARKIKVAPILMQLVHKSLEKGYDEGIIRFILAKLTDIVQTEQFLSLLCEFVQAALNKYEENGLIREKLDRLGGVTPENISRQIVIALVGQLDEMMDQEHPLRIRLAGWLREKAAAAAQNEKLQAAIENWKNQSLAKQENTVLGQLAQQLIEEMQRKIKIGQYPVLQEQAMEVVDTFLDNGLRSPEQREALNHWAQNLILRFVKKWRSYTGNLVREYLSGFTNDKLVAFIEERAGEDLQMIRINGSVVGGLVGMLIFILTFWAERML